VGIPLTVGFRLLRSLWISQSPFTNSSSFTMEFWLSRTFFFSVESRLSRNLSHDLFYTMESRQSLSLFANFSFTWWNISYHGVFSRIFLSHSGISAITEPFHEFFFHMVESRLSQSLFTNISFTWWNLGYHRAFSRTFLSHGGISAITEPFHDFFFHKMEFTKCTIWGKTLFIYITESIYIGSASLKTFPLDLEPPLQGKECNPPYSNIIAKKQSKRFFLRNHL
jgi:hypothetical protein